MERNHLFKNLILAVLVCMVPALSGVACGLMVEYSFTELANSADLVVVGTVESTEGHWNQEHTNIETTVIVSVDDVIKGSLQESRIPVTVRGGTVDGVTQWVEDQPALIPEGQFGLFLRQKGDEYRVLGLYQGLLPLWNALEMRVYGEGDTEYGDTRTILTAAQFREMVTAVLEGREETVMLPGIIPRDVEQDTRAAPYISTVTPSIASAGTGTEITISGTGFGTKANLQSCADVAFFYKAVKYADGSGIKYQILASGKPYSSANVYDIVSWASNQIKARVPSGKVNDPTLDQGFYWGSAASGYVVVYDDSCVRSNEKSFTVKFGYLGLKWDDPAGFFVKAFPGSHLAGSRAAIDAAASTWNAAIPGSYFTLEDRGLTESGIFGGDGVSLVSMADSSEFDDPKTLAETGLWGDVASGTITEVDTRFNAYHSWTTGTASGTGSHSVQAVMLHEFGHWLHLLDLYGDLPRKWPTVYSGYPYDYKKVMFGIKSDEYGNRDLKVLNAHDGDGIKFIYGTNPVPAITSLSPASAPAGAPAFALTVTGSKFVPGSRVRWKGVDRPTTYLSSTLLTASIPASDLLNPGSADVTVFNPTPGGGTSNAFSFPIEYPVPILTSLSPQSIAGGGPAFTLTVTGSKFFPASTVRWSGADRPTTYVSATQLKATIDAADIALKGTFPVTVFNPAPGGGASPAIGFPVTDPPPSILSFSPASAYAEGQAFPLTLSGNGYVSGARLLWNGAERPTTVNSASQITVSIPASDIAGQGTATITVVNADGALSYAVTFTTNTPLPVITTFSPASAKAGGSQFTLRVTGSGFTSGSKVRWKGTDRTSMYLSSTELAATIPATDIASTGTAGIVVYNPSPAATSNTVSFTVNPASGSPPLPPPPGSGEVVTTETSTTYTYLGYSSTYLQQAQSMKAADTGISEVKVALAKKGTPTLNVNFHIRATLKGPDLAWGTITPDMISSTDYKNPTWARLVATDPIAVTKGSTYYFVLDMDSSDLKNYYLVPINGNNPYRDGYHYKNTIGSVNSLYDMLMKVTFTPATSGTPARDGGDAIPLHVSGA